jgi:hypothetical protein
MAFCSLPKCTRVTVSSTELSTVGRKSGTMGLKDDQSPGRYLVGFKRCNYGVVEVLQLVLVWAWGEVALNDL